MKIIACLLLVVVAAVKADVEVPLDERQQRIVTGSIVSAIEDLATSIREAGLDPVKIEGGESSMALSVESVLSANAILNNLEFVGLSNIVVNIMSFGLLTSRLTFDVSIPEISLSVGRASSDVTILSAKITAGAIGRVTIKNIGVNGNVRVSIGVFSGISVRSLAINFYHGGIESNIQQLSILGRDLTAAANDFLSIRVVNALDSHKNEINEVLENLAWQAIENIL